MQTLTAPDTEVRDRSYFYAPTPVDCGEEKVKEIRRLASAGFTSGQIAAHSVGETRKEII